MINIVLASGSRQRRDLLDMIGLNYEIVKSTKEEKSVKTNPSDYVKELSKTKAISVKEQLNTNNIIIAADTIIVCDNKIYEKPKFKDEAYNNMIELSGKENYAYTGICIIDMYKNKTISFCNKTKIKFNKLNNDEIKWYIDNESRIMECCGYVPLGKASLFIDKVNGEYNNIFGLPLNKIYNKLKKLGYTINDFDFKER